MKRKEQVLGEHIKTIDYAQVMEKMGIDISKYKIIEYDSAEKFARQFTKTTIQKHTQVAFSNTTSGISM